MGLLDILNGMQNAPRGQQQPKNIGSSGGMSPIMKALLGVLAYKALKGGQRSGCRSGRYRPSCAIATTWKHKCWHRRRWTWRHSGWAAWRQANSNDRWCQAQRRSGRPTRWSAWWRRCRRRAEWGSRKPHKGVTGRADTAASRSHGSEPVLMRRSRPTIWRARWAMIRSPP